MTLADDVQHETKTCSCGTAVSALPTFFVCKEFITVDAEGHMHDSYEDHMFPGCQDCGETFCSCGQPHALAVVK